MIYFIMNPEERTLRKTVKKERKTTINERKVDCQ